MTADDVADSAILGHYIFEDYAVSKWSEQLCAMIERGTQAQLAEAHDEEAIQEFEDALCEFVELPGAEFIESAEEEAKLGFWREVLEDERAYKQLCAVKAHIHQHSNNGFKTRNKISIRAIEKSFTESRKFLEDPKEEPSKQDLSNDQKWLLDTYYGTARYKCSKLTCDRFYNGFRDAKERKSHNDAHDRPFKCDVPECRGYEFGFTSAHDLEKHRSKSHPTIAEQSETFEFLDTVTAKTAIWPCPHCPKRFTRGFHMRNHIRTHTSEKPFCCTECGKPFTRDYDRKRHEKIHTQR